MKDFTPEEFIGHKVGRIGRNIDKYFDKKRCAHDSCMSRGQGMIMGYIMDTPDSDIFQRDIEAKFHLSGATVTTMLKNLEKNGFIIRTPMENDARLKKIELTSKAIEHEKCTRKNIYKVEKIMREEFSAEEYDRLISYMDRIIESLERLNTDK